MSISPGLADMTHWVTFDHATSTALTSRLPKEAVVHVISQNPIDHALTGKETSVAVLSVGVNHSAVVVFRWKQLHVRTDDPVAALPTRASGMLGLSDEPAYTDEQPEEKKSWWARFWDL